MSAKGPQSISEERDQRQTKAINLYVAIIITLANLRAYIQHAHSSMKTYKLPDISSMGSESDGYIKMLRDEVFPEALYYSFVILVYGIVEDKLKQTCDMISETRKLPLRSKDLRGDTISQCMAFLSKLAGVPHNSIKSLSAIEDLARVRNCIVHTDGYIEKVNEKDRNRIKELVRLRPNLITLRKDAISNQDKLVLSFEYCQDSLFSAASFFEEIFAAKRLVIKVVINSLRNYFREIANR